MQAFIDAGKAVKIDVGISADIERERCQKIIILTAMAGSTAALRSPIPNCVASSAS
jgi:ketopantoate reductase